MCAGLAKWEISLPPSQFCCKFKTAPQNIVLKMDPNHIGLGPNLMTSV